MMQEHTETRSQVIVQTVQDYLRNTGVSMPTLAQQVVEAYHSLVPLHLREVLFREGGDAYQAMRLNAQELRRMFDGEIRLPVDLEEAVVYALPEPWRGQLRRTLARRYGLLGAEQPTGGEAGAIYDAGLMMEQQAEVLQSLAPILADGHIGEHDRKHAPRALEAIRDAQGRLQTIRAELEALMGDAPGLRPVGNQAAGGGKS